jgi:hypothetical protein
VNGEKLSQLRHLRPVGAILSLGAVATALYPVWFSGTRTHLWPWLGGALALAVLWQVRLPLPGRELHPGAEGSTRCRRSLGLLLAAGGAVIFALASYELYQNWEAHFDFAWLGWLSGAAALASGLDLLWGRSGRTEDRQRTRSILWLVLGFVAIAAVYRLGNIARFPGEAGISQVEDLQTGNWGLAYLTGGRTRWEYLSHAWLAALGIYSLGPSLLAMRIPFALVSALKTIPLFLWLRYSAGPIAAVVGTALFVVSGWDVVLSRIPNNQSALVVAAAFWLLAGPAKRGRPSAYVVLGLLGGYVFFEYVVYRPLACFVLAGVVATSLGDRSTGWWWRIARPVFTFAIIAAMTLPLFLGRLSGRVSHEYFNGWNRARASTIYYNPDDTWREAIDRRERRLLDVGSVFYVNGDGSPVKNVSGWPLIDPVTGGLLLIGVGYCLANLMCPLFGLTLVAFLATLGGALVVTANLDVGRAGATVVYVYALAGYGAAAIAEACRRAWGRFGRALAVTLLAAGVLAAGVINTTFLYRYWNARSVQVAMYSSLAMLSGWLRENVRPGEQVVGIAPGNFNVLMPNDAAWLRGREMRGKVAWDVEDALRYWSAHGGETLLFAAAGPGTATVRRYVEWLLPGLEMEWQPDPLGAEGDIAYAHVPGAPPDLKRRLGSLRCQGMRAEFELVGGTSGVVKRFTRVLPFIDTSTWPGEVRDAVFRAPVRPEAIRVSFDATFKIERPGRYTFILESYAGSAEMFIDAGAHPLYSRGPVELDAGEHTLSVRGQFEPLAVEPNIRLSWRGPDTGGSAELIPFYRIAAEDPSCRAAGAVVSAAGDNAGVEARGLRE